MKHCQLKKSLDPTAHLTQFPPEKFPVHLSASQADGVGGGPPPGLTNSPVVQTCSDFSMRRTFFQRSFLRSLTLKMCKEKVGRSAIGFRNRSNEILC
jgi:hypothetical protein